MELDQIFSLVDKAVEQNKSDVAISILKDCLQQAVFQIKALKSQAANDSIMGQ